MKKTFVNPDDVLIDFGMKIEKTNGDTAVFWPYKPKTGYLILSNFRVPLKNAVQGWSEYKNETQSDSHFLIGVGTHKDEVVLASYFPDLLLAVGVIAVSHENISGVWDAEHDKVLPVQVILDELTKH